MANCLIGRVFNEGMASRKDGVPGLFQDSGSAGMAEADRRTQRSHRLRRTMDCKCIPLLSKHSRITTKEQAPVDHTRTGLFSLRLLLPLGNVMYSIIGFNSGRWVTVLALSLLENDDLKHRLGLKSLLLSVTCTYKTR